MRITTGRASHPETVPHGRAGLQPRRTDQLSLGL